MVPEEVGVVEDMAAEAVVLAMVEVVVEAEIVADYAHMDR